MLNYVRISRFRGMNEVRGELGFCVKSWSAWSSSMGSESDWIDWANGEGTNNKELSRLDVSNIPPMKRRRMSQLSKMALSTALDCLDDYKKKPTCVFASKNGELARTIKILTEVAAKQDISPTDFSLSVHNTALGLMSIQTQNTQPGTSVAAGDDTFGYGMLEACFLLHRHPESSVLLVYFDEPLPQVLSSFETNNNEAICIALLLSNSGAETLAANNKDSIHMSFEHTSDSDKIVEDLGKQFLKFYLSSADKFAVNGGHKNWQWRKEC